MSHGIFQCLGSPLQLKNLYGGGYTLSLKVLADADEKNDPCAVINKYITEEVSAVELVEQSVGLMRYRINRAKDGAVPLSEIFQKIENMTAQGGHLSNVVSDYSVSQTSLEEVFLHFATAAEESSPVKPMVLSAPNFCKEEGIEAIN